MNKTKVLVMLVMTIFMITGIAGCKSKKVQEINPSSYVVTDSIGRKITLTKPLEKVVVANAYNAELINAVGAFDTIIGVDYAIYLDQEKYQGKFKESDIIGKSQRELNYEKIIEKAPDALILTGNGNWSDAEKKLSEFGIKVIVLDAYYTGSFKENCSIVGELFGKQKNAQELYEFFNEKLEYINKQLKDKPKKNVYFEYRREGNTTIPGDYFYKMLEYAGANNIFSDAKNVNVSSESIILRNPEYIIKVGEINIPSQYIPPTKEEFMQRKENIRARKGWDSIQAVQKDNILLLSHFSHGGASKLIGTMYIAKYLYPECLPDLNPEEVFKEWLVKYQGIPYIEGHSSPEFALQN